jgi:transcriptional regulator with XRE-family HTH domain
MAEIIKRYRKERGISLRELAGELGMSFQNLQIIESGRGGVSITRAASLAGKLGFDVEMCIAAVLQEQLDKAGWGEYRVLLETVA